MTGRGPVLRPRSIAVLALALAVVAGALDRWRRAEVGGGEHEKAIVPPPAEPAPLASRPPAAAPTGAEVQPALDRVFDRTLAVDEAARPAFVAGDFNGDGVTDLAVAVRPRDPGALSRLNGERAHWLQDMAAPAALERGPVTLAAGDRLLAVIHGVDTGGWRDPDAGPGHVLKNVPDAIRMEVTRAHAGDVLVVGRGGKPGLIVWTGAAYAWVGFEDRGGGQRRPTVR